MPKWRLKAFDSAKPVPKPTIGATVSSL
jgi:hypothetical protein